MSEREHDRQPPDSILDRAVRALRDDGPPAGPPSELVASTVGALSGSPAPPNPARAGERRRRIMRSVRYAAAAAALLVLGALGVFLLNGTPSVALADVVKAAQKHKLVRYKSKETTTDAKGNTGTAEWTVFADLKVPRFRKEMRHQFMDRDDRAKPIEEVTLSVVDLRAERHLMTNTHPGGKVLPPRKDAWLGRARGSKNAKPFLEALQELQQKKGVTSGKDTLGRRETVRFRSEEEIPQGTLTTTLWIDTKTKLPVRLHSEFTWKEGGTTLISETDFQWDPELPRGFRSLDELFSTRPPDGYTLKDDTAKDE